MASPIRFAPLILVVLAVVCADIRSVGAQAYPKGSPQDLAQTWFEAHDRDHDGYLMADEVVNYDLKQFKRMDRDDDGKLSLDEYAAGIPHNQTLSAEAYHARFTQMDADGDGRVTPDELSAYERAVLKQADRDGDGRVGMMEWLAATVGKKEWFPASP
ncbi:MAG: hypothetical protein QOK29_4500 [Rhodospirillaceae bacterium]|jgi:Ca2+-binding EF-hand superfamily protein|nr:hypothetical protein [Rhodospirillaceae bacterium]